MLSPEMSELAHTPKLGDSVIYYDDNRQPQAAIVVAVSSRISAHTDRPICNLASWGPNGFSYCRRNVEPARFDDSLQKWKLVNKWALPDEVPDSEWDYI